ncbi:hypothetical protein [Tabrizicola piscis]|nr:hypothetical protein [Tabrizicola piscis]
MFLTDAEGSQIPGAEPCHLVDQMRHLMQIIVNRLYDFFLKTDDP